MKIFRDLRQPRIHFNVIHPVQHEQLSVLIVFKTSSKPNGKISARSFVNVKAGTLKTIQIDLRLDWTFVDTILESFTKPIQMRIEDSRCLKIIEFDRLLPKRSQEIKVKRSFLKMRNSLHQSCYFVTTKRSYSFFWHIILES